MRRGNPSFISVEKKDAATHPKWTEAYQKMKNQKRKKQAIRPA